MATFKLPRFGPVNAWAARHVDAVGPVADLDAVLLAPGPCDDHLEVVVGNGGLGEHKKVGGMLTRC